jgi:hypothetical protein
MAGELQESPEQFGALGKGILEQGGFKKLEGLQHGQFFTTSDVDVSNHLSLRMYNVPNVFTEAFPIPIETRAPILGEYRQGIGSILRQVFEDGYKEVEQSDEDPIVESAAQRAFVGQDHSLQLAREQMGDTRLARTLQIISHFTNVRLLQALIQEQKSEIASTGGTKDSLQIKFWQSQILDRLKASGMLLMRDAAPSILTLAEATMVKVNALKSPPKQ